MTWSYGPTIIIYVLQTCSIKHAHCKLVQTAHRTLIVSESVHAAYSIILRPKFLFPRSRAQTAIFSHKTFACGWGFHFHYFITRLAAYLPSRQLPNNIFSLYVQKKFILCRPDSTLTRTWAGNSVQYARNPGQ